jgi:hypothetical protein
MAAKPTKLQQAMLAAKVMHCQMVIWELVAYFED